MDVKRARSPRAPADGDDDKRRPAAGWRGAVRPEMVLLGFLITLPFLAFAFGGHWSAFPSVASSSSSIPKVGRHAVPRAGPATPKSKHLLLFLCTQLIVRPLNYEDRVPRKAEEHDR